jgi:gliding motility-associated-like protein
MKKTVFFCVLLTNFLLFSQNPITNPIASQSFICEGNILTLTANPSSGTPPYSFSWIGPNGFTSLVENPTITTTAANSGVFSLIVTDSNNVNSVISYTNYVSVIVKVNPEFDGLNPGLCKNGTPPLLPIQSTNGINGTWNPAIVNNTTVGVFYYTFTPNAGQCANSFVQTIYVVNSVNPTFSIPTSICQGSTPPNLPNNSNNGIQGSWNPAIVDNTTSGTYTFTPNIGQCAQVRSYNITVNPTVTPSFTLPAFICQNQAAPNLPTISNNGITGAWSPAILNNTDLGNHTYIFTPDNPNQCSLILIISIPVNPNITSTFNPINPFCEGSVAPTLPSTSNNGITGTWNPATISNTASGNYIFTPNPNQCAAVVSINIIVNPNITPVFTQIPGVCFQTTNIPTLTNTSNNGIIGTWNPATISNTNSGTYTFTPNANQCATTTTMSININTINPTFNTITPICINNTAPDLQTTSNNGIIGTWSPLTVSNTASGTYTFTPNPNQCATVVSINIIVNPYLNPTFTQIAPLCSGSENIVLPLSSIEGITGTWNPATISNTSSGTYTFTANSGQCSFNFVMNITVLQSPTDIDFEVTSLLNQTLNGEINIISVTSGLSPFTYSMDNGNFSETTSYVNLAFGEHTITVKDANGCLYTEIVNVESICVFPKGISPNNDGKNDTFNLNGCNVNSLEIFNRYGLKVNSFNNYSNQWNGTSSNGQELPDGTYYYVAVLNNNTKTGWVYINR